MKRQSARSLQHAILMLAAGWLVMVSGCGAGQGKEADPRYILYPPPPEPPRLQFLASYSDEMDLGRKVSKFATFVTGQKPPSQPIVKPCDALLANNQLWVCDAGTRSLHILDLAQKTMRQFVPPVSGKLGLPIGLAVDADGTRYVADSGRNQVMIYGGDDLFRGVIGEGDSWQPTEVALTKNRLYVADLKASCVRVYDKVRWTLLFTVPQHPEAGEDPETGRLFLPSSLAVGQDGLLYVCDTVACRVQVYGPDGTHLKSLGSRGDLPGQFTRPKGVAVDHEDRVYVLDAATQACQIFDAQGRLLLQFGEPGGSAAPLDHPATVTVDYDHVGFFQRYAAPGFTVDHLAIITNQAGQRKISIYGFGRRQ